MPICPKGHTSGTDDFCDVCGDLIPGAPRVRFDADEGPEAPVPQPSGAESEGGEACPLCGTPRGGRFCEVDAYDFETGRVGDNARLFAEPPAPEPPIPEPPAPEPSAVPEPPASGPSTAGPSTPGPPPAEVRWTVVISADRAYYDSVIAQGGPDAASLAFPPYCPDRHVDLVAGAGRDRAVRIGRRSVSRGLEPEIDLSVPPADPGVSHLHAVLLPQPDGTWLLVDPGSTNGTTLNGDTKPVDVNVPVPVGDGDRIHIGAWTTLTLVLRSGPPGGSPPGPGGGSPA